MNLLLVLLNMIALAVALLVGEYELAKIRHPDTSWLATPQLFDLVMIVTISLLTVTNLSVLFFVIIRRLEHHHKWLWWTTALASLFALVLAVVLGDRFLPIIFP